jgi:hypothetical protein
VPECRRPPSEYVREHVRFTTQPLEEPEPHAQLLRVMDWLGAEDLLMFSSDYPHYDFDNPQWVMSRLGRDKKARILAGNAIELFGLPSVRPRDAMDKAREDFLANPSTATMTRTRPGRQSYFAAQED